jgi:DNA modification methylase
MEDQTWKILQGDCREVLKTLPEESINCVVTSPPYWGLRDYGVDGQLGLEEDPFTYVENLVQVFREVRRALRKDGVVFLNLGDSFAANRSYQVSPTKWDSLPQGQASQIPVGLKPKDLIGIPWRVAFALQADGWWLRSDIIWHKLAPMPESAHDRPTRAHEYVFLLAKAEHYYYNAEAIKEPASDPGRGGVSRDEPEGTRPPGSGPRRLNRDDFRERGRNKRDVWSLTTESYPGDHFAVMPTALVEPCVLAGCPPDGTVLDPFAGVGTTLLVATSLGRRSIGIELNPKSIEDATLRLQGGRRIHAPNRHTGVAPLLDLLPDEPIKTDPSDPSQK